MKMTMAMTMDILHCHVIHNEYICTNIRHECNNMEYIKITLYIVNRDGNRILCVPLSVMQGDCQMVLKYRRKNNNENKGIKQKKKKNEQCSFYLLYSLLSYNKSPISARMAYYQKTIFCHQG